MFRRIKKLSTWRRILLIYMVFIGGVIITVDIDLLSLDYLAVIPHYDWIAHFLLYGIMVVLIERSFPPKDRGIRRFRSLAIVLAFALLEELSQIFFASRTFSLMDLAFSFAGILYFYRRCRPRARMPSWSFNISSNSS